MRERERCSSLKRLTQEVLMMGKRKQCDIACFILFAVLYLGSNLVFGERFTELCIRTLTVIVGSGSW